MDGLVEPASERWPRTNQTRDGAVWMPPLEPQPNRRQMKREEVRRRRGEHGLLENVDAFGEARWIEGVFLQGGKEQRCDRGIHYGHRVTLQGRLDEPARIGRGKRIRLCHILEHDSRLTDHDVPMDEKRNAAAWRPALEPLRDRAGGRFPQIMRNVEMREQR